jgi:nucleotide-binding universal stress UspA family protein
MTAIAIGLLWFYRASLVPVPEPVPASLGIEQARTIEGPAENGQGPADERGTLVIAVGGPSARQVCAMTVPLARAQASTVHVLHVIEHDIVAGEDDIELESTAAATEMLDACVAELREAGVPVVGELLHSVGTHADVAQRILDRAAQLSPIAIVLGPETHHGPLVARVSAEIAARAASHVIVLHPEAGPLVPA